jgi:DNA-binding NtrC family response regulator
MSQPSILIVDDELLIRDLLYDFFNGQGWDTIVADSGEKALEIIESKDVDLVLSDIRMPGMDGLELTAELRQMHPDIPVVLMTGYPSVDTAVAALRQKVSDYVTKPFNINKLYKIVAAQLRVQKDNE